MNIPSFCVVRHPSRCSSSFCIFLYSIFVPDIRLKNVDYEWSFGLSIHFIFGNFIFPSHPRSGGFSCFPHVSRGLPSADIVWFFRESKSSDVLCPKTYVCFTYQYDSHVQRKHSCSNHLWRCDYLQNRDFETIVTLKHILRRKCMPSVCHTLPGKPERTSLIEWRSLLSFITFKGLLSDTIHYSICYPIFLGFFL